MNCTLLIRDKYILALSHPQATQVLHSHAAGRSAPRKAGSFQDRRTGTSSRVAMTMTISRLSKKYTL